MEPLGKDILNFQSEKAYKYFINCSDNHKAWQTFEILLHGTVLELIHLYSSSCTHVQPTRLGFLQWQSETASSTLKLVFNLFLTYGLGIYIQRIGDRNNDSNVSDAGRYAFLDFFYGFNHPLYQEIEYRDLRNKARYPSEVKKQLEENHTFSTINTTARAQGGDFILEQKVKKTENVGTQRNC